VNEGGWGVPQRDEREHLGHGDSLEEQRGLGAKALPHEGRPPDSAETKPTTFETLTERFADFNIEYEAWSAAKITNKLRSQLGIFSTEPTAMTGALEPANTTLTSR
jgi:hypothetical protein